MKWFRRKEQPPTEIHHVYDVLPHFDFETATDKTFTEYIKSLTRIQLIELYDRNIIPDHLYDYFADVFYSMDSWPSIDDEVSAMMNKFWYGGDTVRYKFPELQKQVEGIQKKIDRIVKLLEKVEVCTDAKTVLEL